MFVRFFRTFRHILLSLFLALFQSFILLGALFLRQPLLEDRIVQIQQHIVRRRPCVHHPRLVVGARVHLCLGHRRQPHLVLQDRLPRLPPAHDVQSPAARHRQLQQADLLLLRQQPLGALPARLLLAAVDVVGEGRGAVAAAFQHPVGQQVVVVELFQLRLRLLVPVACQAEVPDVGFRIADGEILFPRLDRAGLLMPAPVHIDIVNH